MSKPSRRAQLGVSVEEYDAMLAAQGGGCAICGNPPKTRRLDVDHDHRTGQIRGLLCHRCNRALASWVTPRWLIFAAAYLDGDDWERPTVSLPPNPARVSRARGSRDGGRRKETT